MIEKMVEGLDEVEEPWNLPARRNLVWYSGAEFGTVPLPRGLTWIQNSHGQLAFNAKIQC
jgi:hypothetical protein